jgi:hypothetical protein
MDVARVPMPEIRRSSIPDNAVDLRTCASPPGQRARLRAIKTGLFNIEDAGSTFRWSPFDIGIANVCSNHQAKTGPAVRSLGWIWDVVFDSTIAWLRAVSIIKNEYDDC